MRHEEVAARLPGYASGTLADADERAVRAHLASGCRECLGEVFRRPVGLPRGAKESGGAGRTRRPSPTWAAAAFLIGVGAAAAAATTAIHWHDDGGEGAPGESAAAAADETQRLRERLHVLETTADDLRARTQDLTAERQGLRSDVARLAGRAREAERHAAGLRAELDRDGRRLTRLEEMLAASRPLLETAAASRLGFARFRPARRHRQASGHVLWDAATRHAFVYAFDLPFADQPEGWVVRLTVDAARDVGDAVGSARTTPLGALRPTAARAARARLELPEAMGCEARLEVVSADRGELAMAARLASCDAAEPPA